MLTQVPEFSRLMRLHTVGFRAVGAVSIDWAESFSGAVGRNVYLTMAYDSKVAPASVSVPRMPSAE